VIEAVFKTAEVLDSKNWTEATEGKNAFVMFYAPWCGHCKKIKESYDSLAEDMKKNYSVIIAKVDCTKNHNKDLCKMYGIKSFPTLKYFNEQTDPRGGIYEGEREQWEMKKFLDEKFARTCSVVNLELCPEAMQTELREYVDMDTETRAAALKQLTGEVDAAKERFRTDIAAIQQQYDVLVERKKGEIAAVQPRLKAIRRVIKGVAMAEREAREAAEAEVRRAAEMAAREAEEGSCSADGEGESCDDEEDEDEDE